MSVCLFAYVDTFVILVVFFFEFDFSSQSLGQFNFTLIESFEGRGREGVAGSKDGLLVVRDGLETGLDEGFVEDFGDHS